MNLRRDNIEILVPDTLLHRYVDVLLSRQQRRTVETAIARNPELARSIDAWRAQNLGIQRLAATQSLPPMPQDMRNATRRLSGRIRPRAGFRAVYAAVCLVLVTACTLVWLIGPQTEVTAKQKIPIIIINQ